METRGAGAGQLTVRVRGPKGAFNVEMQREKRNERTIHCKYEPKEPGDYQVNILLVYLLPKNLTNSQFA